MAWKSLQQVIFEAASFKYYDVLYVISGEEMASVWLSRPARPSKVAKLGQIYVRKVGVLVRLRGPWAVACVTAAVYRTSGTGY